jgi:hypothetical protein
VGVGVEGDRDAMRAGTEEMGERERGGGMTRLNNYSCGFHIISAIARPLDRYNV